jgi:hypothetical protein
LEEFLNGLMKFCDVPRLPNHPFIKDARREGFDAYDMAGPISPELDPSVLWDHQERLNPNMMSHRSQTALEYLAFQINQPERAFLGLLI